jgi:hypothetical protein
MANLKIKINCPYCGVDTTGNVYTDEIPKDDFYLFNCPKDTGGCGKPYLVTLKFELVVESIKKVEGYK